MNDASLYRCLANPTRLTALKALRHENELSVSELVEITGSEQTNLSHHLAELRACGLVKTRQDGKRVCYQVAHPGLDALLELAERFAAHVECSDTKACTAAGCC